MTCRACDRNASHVQIVIPGCDCGGVRFMHACFQHLLAEGLCKDCGMTVQLTEPVRLAGVRADDPHTH